MRELSFQGFLKKYVRDLSYQGTNNIYKLVREATEYNPRLIEPLVLYASLNGKLNELNNAISHYPDLRKELMFFYNSKSDFSDFDNLPAEYRKVYDSFMSVKNRFENDNHTKKLMHAKIKRLQSFKNVTNYRIYTDLSLNPGNFNSFMKNEDTSKVSLETLRNVIEYLEKY